jgi:hypothetical protein
MLTSREALGLGRNREKVISLIHETIFSSLETLAYPSEEEYNILGDQIEALVVEELLIELELQRRYGGREEGM